MFTCINHCSQDVWWFDQLLQNVCFGCQRKPIIQHLIQELVHHHIVVLDSGLSDVVEVVLEGVSNTVEKLDDKERRNLSHTHRHIVDIGPDDDK